MQKKPTIATDPYTGRPYDFRPLFEYCNHYGVGLELITGIARKTVRYSYCVIIRTPDISDPDASQYAHDVNDLYDLFQKITESAPI